MSEVASAWAMLGLRGTAQPVFTCAECHRAADTFDQAYMKTFLLAQVLHLNERAQMVFIGLVLGDGVEQWLIESCRMSPPDAQSVIARACDLGLLVRTSDGYDMAAPRCKICWARLASSVGLSPDARRLLELPRYPGNR